MATRPFFSLILLLLLTVGCSRALRESPADDRNVTVVRRYINEVWNDGKLHVVDEIVAPAFIDHDAANPPGLPPGSAGLKQHVAAMRAAFPDVRFAIEDILAAGDKVITRWSVRGTHKGPLMGMAPTNKEVVVTGIWIDRLSDGKIVEEWANWDTIGLLRQIGALPRR